MVRVTEMQEYLVVALVTIFDLFLSFLLSSAATLEGLKHFFA